MIDDPIVEEIGRFCKEYAAKYGNNLQRIVEALREKERHLDELHDKLRDARGDDFRSVVSGWISEEEAGIGDVKEKLRRGEDWIYEDKEKLRT